MGPQHPRSILGQHIAEIMRTSCVSARYAGRVNLRSTAAKSFICSSMAVLAMNPAKVDALSLGAIDIQSELGQPLSAVVPVHVGKGEVLTSTCIASSAERTGLTSPNDIVIDSSAVGQQPGSYQIRITTPKPLHEPMYEVSLVVDCPRIPLLVRHYVVMLDLPGTLNPTSAIETEAPVQSANATTLRPAAPDNAPPTPVAPRPTASHLRAFRSDDKTIAAGRRYRVGKGDTLSTIAERVTGRPPDTIWRVADEIFKTNKHAFIRNDVDLIMLGAWINIPDADYLASIGEPVPLPEPGPQRAAMNNDGSPAANTPASEPAALDPVVSANLAVPAEATTSDIVVTDAIAEAPAVLFSPMASAPEVSGSAASEPLFSEVVAAESIISGPMETGSMASEPLFADVALPDPLASVPLATRPMASDTATAGRIPTRAVAADPAPSSPIALRPKAADQAETGRMVASTDITSPVISAPTNSEPVVPANPDGPVVAARPVAANLIDATPVILESVEPADAVPAASSPVSPDPIVSDPIIFELGVSEPIMSSEPIAAETLFSDIEASDPIIAGPVAPRPVATDPIIPEHATSDPVAARPAASGRADAGPVTAGTTPSEADFAAPINSSAAISESIAVADTSLTEPADPGPAVAASAVADPVLAKPVLAEPIVVEPVIDEPVIDEPGTSVSDVAANQESIRPDINLPVGSVAGADTENQQLASNATEGPVVEDRANISPFVDDFPPEIPTDIESRVDATKNVVSRTTSPEISPFVAIAAGILLGLALSLLILRQRLLKPLKALFGSRDSSKAFVHESFLTSIGKPFKRRKSKMGTNAHADALLAEDTEFMEAAADAAFENSDAAPPVPQFIPTTQPFEETYIVEIIPNTEPTRHDESILKESVASADTENAEPAESDQLSELELSDTSTLAYLFDDQDDSNSQNVIDPTVKIPAQDHPDALDPTAHMPTVEMPAQQPSDSLDPTAHMPTVEMPAQQPSDGFDPTVQMPPLERSDVIDPTAEVDMEAFDVDETMMAQAFTEELEALDEALDSQDLFQSTDEPNEDDDLLAESANFDPLTGLDNDELPEGFDEDQLPEDFDEDEPFSDTLRDALSLPDDGYDDEFTDTGIIEPRTIKKDLDSLDGQSKDESDDDNTLNRSRRAR